MLVTATWMGVGEEIIEGVFEVGSVVCVEAMGECTSVNTYFTIVIYYIIMIGAITELSMGIYLFSTFSDAIYVGMGIGIQSLFSLIATIGFCVVSYFLVTRT